MGGEYLIYLCMWIKENVLDSWDQMELEKVRQFVTLWVSQTEELAIFQTGLYTAVFPWGDAGNLLSCGAGRDGKQARKGSPALYRIQRTWPFLPNGGKSVCKRDFEPPAYDLIDFAVQQLLIEKGGRHCFKGGRRRNDFRLPCLWNDWTLYSA